MMPVTTTTTPAPAQSLEDWLQEHPNLRFISEGGFGAVYSSADRAIKCQSLDDENNPYKEVRILQIAQLAGVPHVPRIHEAPFVSGDRQIAFKMDLSSEDLEDTYCKEDTPFASYERIQDVTRMALRALSGAHKIGIAHFDIKPANITLNHVVDWGLAELLPPSMLYEDTDRKISPRYEPPEEILRLSLTVAADIWCLGCVLYEMATKTPFANIFYGYDEDQVAIDLLTAHTMRLQKAVNPRLIAISPRKEYLYDQTPEGEYVLKPSNMRRRLTPLSSALALANPLDISISRWDQLIDLIEQMLNMDPEKRITADEALRHPFFQPTDQLADPGEMVFTSRAYDPGDPKDRL